MDYSFASIGSDGFEQLAQALAAAELGSSVKPLGRGRDKGRDAYFQGQVNHQRSDGKGAWNGYGVIQAKHLARDVDTTANIAWVKKQISSELKKWLPGKNGESSKRELAPEYYLLVTNATLSPEGYDACLAELREYAEKLDMTDCDLWSREPVSRFLDNHVNIRQTYLNFIVPGDLIAALESAYEASNVADLGKQISASSAVELGERQWARLGDAGLESEDRLRLANVAIDVPSLLVNDSIDADDWRSVATLRHALSQGDQFMRKSNELANRGILLVGGPGQGKSTVAQLVCQIYRAALLNDNSTLNKEQARLVDEMKSAAARIGLELPTHRRWPAYIDLSKFADEITKDEDYSLLKYIASQIRVQGSTLLVSEILKWRKIWPWAVVLDGLDEVANAQIRERVLRAINDFLTDCNVNDVDILVIATTRPQGYHGELDGFELERLELQLLTPDQALEYGKLHANSRHHDDPIVNRSVVERLKEASLGETTRRLMTTPLQVTIMSTLLERLNRVPETRHALFNEYYKAIYSRETDKAGALGRLLANHQNVIDYVHEQVGLFLQAQGEKAFRSESLLSDSELTPLILKRLREDGHSPLDAELLASQVLEAVRNRVVLLVGLRAGYVGFEVRSIQEYFAARAITNGSETEILDRLAALIPAAYWRNTWLLAAGRLQGHSNPGIVDSLLMRLEEADIATSIAIEVGPAERLSLDLLEDQFSVDVPRIRHILLGRALGMLNRWGDSHLRKLARVAALEMNHSNQAHEMIRAAVQRGLNSTGPSRSTTVSLLMAWQKSPGKPGTLASFQLGKNQGWRPERDVRRPRISIDKLLDRSVDRSNLSSAQAQLIDRALIAFGRISVGIELSAAEVATVTKRNEFVIMPEIMEALDDDVVLRRLLAATATLTEAEGAAAVYIHQYYIVHSNMGLENGSNSIAQPGLGLFPTTG